MGFQQQELEDQVVQVVVEDNLPQVLEEQEILRQLVHRKETQVEHQEVEVEVLEQ